MLSSWFGPNWPAIDSNVRAVFLPIFWAEESSQAGPEALERFETLMYAKRVQRGMSTFVPWFALTSAVMAVIAFIVAFTRSANPTTAAEVAGYSSALRGDEGAPSGTTPRAGSALPASTPAPDAEGDVEQGTLREPLLDSNEVTSVPAAETLDRQGRRRGVIPRPK